MSDIQTTTAEELDRLIWTSLDGEHARFAVGSENARRFHPSIGPLAAVRDCSERSLAELSNLVREMGPVGVMQPGEPLPVPGVEAVRSALGVQMIFTGDEAAIDAANRAPADPRLEPLGTDDYPEMLALARLTEPGPFEERTGDLGKFWGIRHKGRLVAMAGQRLRTARHVEVSAVCTHPDARGNGYAALLSRRVIAAILGEGRRPILHSYADNEVALALYRKLGFAERSQVSLTLYAPQA